MIPHPLSTIQLPRMLRGCIYAARCCALFGAADDIRSQSKSAVCAGLGMSAVGCARMVDATPITVADLPLCGAFSPKQRLRIWTGQFAIFSWFI